MGYEVHKFENAVGDVWFQVGKRSWLFWVKWDVGWPWVSTRAWSEIPNRFETVEEAYDRLDELVLQDKLSSTHRLGPVGRPAPTEDILDEINMQTQTTYSVASLPQEPPTVTETKPKAKTKRSRKKKP